MCSFAAELRRLAATGGVAPIPDIKVYLDTNIVSRLSDVRVTPATADAYAALADMQVVEFVTSEKSRQEVRQATNPTRNAVLQLLVSFIDKVSAQTIRLSGAVGGAPIGATPLGGDWTDPLYERLTATFDPDDAEHIVHAVRGGCDYFLTLDEESHFEARRGEPRRRGCGMRQSEVRVTAGARCGPAARQLRQASIRAHEQYKT